MSMSGRLAAPRILIVTEGDYDHPGARVRALQYVPYLRNFGLACRTLSFWSNRSLRQRRYKPRRAMAELLYPAKILLAVALAARYDTVLLQVALLPQWVQRRLFRYGRNVVFEFDDPIYFASSASSVPVPWRYERLVHMIRGARAVIVSNAMMLALARQHNASVHLFVGPVDTDRYRPHRKGDRTGPVAVGWVGTSSTTRYLAEVRGALRRARTAVPDLRVELIGGGRVPLDVPYVNRPWSIASEASDLTRFDIGIMPLPDSEWTRGKGGYKLLQYMALGIPSVASPIGINADLIEDDVNGFHAWREDDWVGRLVHLAEDPSLRRRLGTTGRELAETRYSLRVAAPRMAQLLTQVSRGMAPSGTETVLGPLRRCAEERA
jgi:glycosyltransferase involved in cell wall biosynthesis